MNNKTFKERLEEILTSYGSSEAQEVFAQEGYGPNKFRYTLEEATQSDSKDKQ